MSPPNYRDYFISDNKRDFLPDILSVKTLYIKIYGFFYLYT